MDTKDEEEKLLHSVAIQNAKSILLERQRVERELAEEKERLRITLASIGDAVISTDAEGRVTFLNGVAEVLTGWPQAEAAGRPLADVFQIVNQNTRRPVDNPALRALSEGRVVGLSEPTILRGKDGTERPIDDSAAPIRDRVGGMVGAVLVFRDVTERNRAEEAQAQLAAIVESSQDAILSKTLDGVIRSWNRGAERLFGYTREEVIGQPITFIIPPERMDEERAILERLCRGERIEHFETVRLAKDGRLLDMSISVSPIRDREGRLIGASKIGRDITYRKEAELLLQRAKEEAEVASRAKSMFLANMSHELRTPLNAVIGYSEMLIDEVRDLGLGRLVPDLERIQGAGRHLLALIDGILDLSKIEAGKIEIFAEPIDMAALLRDSADMARPLCQRNGNTLVVRGEDGLGVLYTDGTKLKQIIFNLLSNSSKFTRDGTVTLTAGREHRGEGEWLRLAVSDTGIGIAPEQMSQLFQAFSQGEASITRNFGGTGLGLAISRRFCQMLGGDITVESEPGKGSIFTVLLPVSPGT